MRFSICRVKIVGPARIDGGAWELRGGAWEVRGGIARPATLEARGGPWEVRGVIALGTADKGGHAGSADRPGTRATGAAGRLGKGEMRERCTSSH